MSSIVLSPAQAKKLTTWTVIGGGAVAIPNTGNTTENILATLAVAAGAMGPNGILRITSLWTFPASTSNAKTPRVKFGGTTFYIFNYTTQGSAQLIQIIRNRNNQASQVAHSSNSSGVSNPTAPVVTAAINTALAQNIELTAQLALGSEIITLEGWHAEVFYGA